MHARNLVPARAGHCSKLDAVSDAHGALCKQAKQHLERMQVDITAGLDKLQTREKYLNEQFEARMRQYRFIREQLSGVQVPACTMLWGRAAASCPGGVIRGRLCSNQWLGLQGAGKQHWTGCIGIDRNCSLRQSYA
jgi:hypothetical protein